MKVAIVGTGYVGVVTGACLASLGHEITCVDSDPRRAALVAGGEAPFHEPGLAERLGAALECGRLRVAGSVEEAVRDSDVSILAVGTPFGGERIDLGAIEAGATAVGRALREANGYHVVAVKSTVVPGTTDTVVRRAVEAASGRSAGEFGLCVNPEFLREGSAVADFLHPDRIVIGRWDPRSGAVLAELYADFHCPTLITGLRNAEMIKYAANALLATLVSYSNEIAGLCERMPGLDEGTVMSGVHLDRRLTPLDDRSGRPPGILAYLSAGIGFGGSCLPKDIDALRAFAVAAVNRERPGRVVGLLAASLGGLAGANVALLGLAFKPGTDDCRDSPALALAARLLEEGARVSAYDPLIQTVPGLDRRVGVCTAAEAALAGADAAVVATAWPEFAALDWHALTRAMRRRVILDGRNALRGVALPADTTYLRIGCRPEEPPRT